VWYQLVHGFHELVDDPHARVGLVSTPLGKIDLAEGVAAGESSAPRGVSVLSAL
jgi:hypothetical protein